MKTGVPAASGATLPTAVTKRRKTALSLPSPFGTTSTRNRPSVDIQVFFSSVGRGSMLTRSAPRRCLAWRSVDLVGAEGILQKKAGVLDQSELGVLIVWNEAFQRQHPADLWQLAQLLGSGRGLGEIAFEHIDGIRARVGNFHQVEQCHD